MRWGKYRFGSLKIDGKAYEKDLVLDQGACESGRRSPRAYRDQFGHTPVSPKEAIPWQGKRLVIGTGMHGQLPIVNEAVAEARWRGVEVVTCPTPEAIQHLQEVPEETNAILHVTC